MRKELQDAIAPLVIGWGYEGESTFISRHEQHGTRDPAAYLTVPAAIEWQRDHDWDEVRQRCRRLAARAPARLGLEPLGTGLQMVAMRLPPDAPADLQRRLYEEYGIEIPVFESETIRASFQGYNDESDLDVLSDALDALLPTRAEA